jgi:hypothetical protein
MPVSVWYVAGADGLPARPAGAVAGCSGRNRAGGGAFETAVNGRAAVLVTFNRRDFEAAEDRFGINVLPPADAVRRLENQP